MNIRSIKHLTPRRWLLILLGAAFLLTLGWALHFQIVPVVDARHYQDIAANIAAHNGYRLDPFSGPLATDPAIASVGPLYEFFLALLFRTFHSQLAFVWFAQTLLDIATGFLLFFIARRAFGRAEGEYAGLIAVGAYLFFIDVIQMPAMLMTETLYLFLLTFATYLFVRFYEKPSYVNAALLGIVSAFAVLTRPTALLVLAIALAAGIALRQYRQTLLIFVCATLMIAPWTIRNYYVYHSFILTTAAGGYDFWLGNNPGANGGAHPTPEIIAYSASHSFTETAAHGSQEFKRFVIEHPFAEVKLLFEKGVAYMSVARPYAFWFYLSGLSQSIVLVWSAAWSFALFVCGLSGAWLLWQAKKSLYRWLLLLALAMPVSVIPILVETRYRMPLYPFLALFAGYFIYKYWCLCRERPQDRTLFKVLAVAAALIVADTVFDSVSHFGLILQRLGL